MRSVKTDSTRDKFLDEDRHSAMGGCLHKDLHSATQICSSFLMKIGILPWASVLTKICIPPLR